MTIQTNYREDDEPFTLKKDSSIPEYDRDVKLSSNEVEEALNARNQSVSEDSSIVLNCSTKAMYPITFIDTTGNEDEKQLEEVYSHKQANKRNIIINVIVIIISHSFFLSNPYILRSCFNVLSLLSIDLHYISMFIFFSVKSAPQTIEPLCARFG